VRRGSPHLFVCNLGIHLRQHGMVLKVAIPIPPHPDPNPKPPSPTPLPEPHPLPPPPQPIPEPPIPTARVAIDPSMVAGPILA
jgi:hypothetical protein